MSRLEQQLQFCLEIDKEKQIKRQTLVSDGSRQEDDAEHAWHLAIMAMILREHANEDIDLLRVMSMVLIHDLVEVYAGDTYAYDTEGLKTQKEREMKAAKRLYGILPKDQEEEFMNLWLEFEEEKTPESKFAHTLDNFQPAMLNDATLGSKWREHQVHLSQILKRNEHTKDGSQTLWDYQVEHIIQPNVENGNIKSDE